MDVLKFCLLVLVCDLMSEVRIHAQDSQSGFISIDCGNPDSSNYTETKTGINYVSDEGLIDTGETNYISTTYISSIEKTYQTLRSFPQGNRSCYILKPPEAKSKKFLIRATFLYGNYDGKNELPQFDLHLGADYWNTVNIIDAITYERPEIVHVPTSDTIYLCLVNTGKGTPFISSLELRPLNNAIYATQSGSLSCYMRSDYGNNGVFYRYKDDIYDRIWSPAHSYTSDSIISTTSIVDTTTNYFEPPSSVMSTASTPLDPSLNLIFNFTASATSRYYTYMHFAELEELEPNQTREFDIYLNGNIFYRQFSPVYLKLETIYFDNAPLINNTEYTFSFVKTESSTHPPIFNALEVYKVVDMLHALTRDLETSAMYSIKSAYKISRNWQGDPCAPKEYVWEGVNCSYNGFESPKVISLNLSSSGLTGSILSAIANLSNLQALDLSNNRLKGEIPDFLGNLSSLKVLDIKGNSFTGPIPSQLLDKWNDESLLLSADGLPSADGPPPPNNEEVKKKKSNVVLPIVASIIAVLVILIIVGVLWIVRRKRRARKKSSNNGHALETNNKQFNYSEILSITNNFQTVIGRGGFGIVYHGKIGDAEVAVKMFSSSLDEGFRELKSEINVLMNVHHKNLTSLVGYCIDGEHVGIIYEFMANGDLKGQLSGKNLYAMNWDERVQIALDAAQGLEYLHHGINKAIIHRDVKCTNILLNKKFQAKISDFGLSRAYPAETVTHVSTKFIAGSPGYLDPEYQLTGRLTEKSDVYSFGMVILEIITGKTAIMTNNPDPPISLASWVGWTMRQRDIQDIVDARLMGEFPVSSAKKAVEIAMACVANESVDRPTMIQVVMLLKECLAMDNTPKEKI